MSTNETETKISTPPAAVAKEAPTEQQTSQTGVPKRFVEGQTVCNEKNEKGKLCNGHLKQVSPINEDAKKHMRGDDLLYKCQTCGALYMGPPLGHVRDPKQSRYVMKEQNLILQAAGGTLPAFKRSETGALVPVEEHGHHAPAPVASAAATAKPVTTKPAPPAKVGAPNVTSSAATTSGTDSSPSADVHRPAAEAQAATGQASAAPLSPAAATASPAAGAETPADLAPEASTELTPGAPKNEAAPKPPEDA